MLYQQIRKISPRTTSVPGRGIRGLASRVPRVGVVTSAVGDSTETSAYDALARAEPVYLVSTQEMVSPVTNLLSSTERSVLFLGRSMG